MKVTVLVAVQLPLNTTVRPTLYVPGAVGVPEIRPVDVGGASPGGNPVAL
jgi:hypothetical protein